jgi:hypothetical protein
VFGDRSSRLEPAAPALQARSATLLAQVEAPVGRNRPVRRLVRESLPCATASIQAPSAGPTMRRELPSREAMAPWKVVTLAAPDPASSDALRQQIDERSQEREQFEARQSTLRAAAARAQAERQALADEAGTIADRQRRAARLRADDDRLLVAPRHARGRPRHARGGAPLQPLTRVASGRGRRAAARYARRQ